MPVCNFDFCSTSSSPRASSRWVGTQQPSGDSGSNEHCCSLIILGSNMRLLCSMLRYQQGSPDACGCPESTVVELAALLFPSIILLSVHLDLWYNCIISDKFLYKSLYKNKTPSMIKRGCPLAHGVEFWRGSAGRAMGCCCWLLLYFIDLFSHLYPSTGARALAWEYSEITLEASFVFLFVWRQWHNGKWKHFCFLLGEKWLTQLTASLPADLKHSSASQVINTISGRKDLSFLLTECGNQRGGMRKCSEPQSTPVLPYTTGLGLREIRYVR